VDNGDGRGINGRVLGGGGGIAGMGRKRNGSLYRSTREARTERSGKMGRIVRREVKSLERLRTSDSQKFKAQCARDERVGIGGGREGLDLDTTEEKIRG